MSDETPEPQGEASDPTAIALALTKGSAAVDGEIIAFLRDQRHHLHEQARHLREQLALKLWELRMGVVLRVATAVVGIAVAGGLAYLVWDAAHSKGLIVEPFNVPADMAVRGLTGEVIASQVIDKLSHMTKSESSRAVQTYANNWGNNIKVEIPETGVSIGELRNFLRDWLGHDIRITGEVYKTADGIAVTARTGGNEGATFTGKESDLDALMQQAAEHVYEVTQPYRYANYLDRNYDPRGLEQRVAKARAIYWKLIAGDDPVERAWAWNGLGTIAFRFEIDDPKSIYYYRKAIAEVPGFLIATFALSGRGVALDEEEEYNFALDASRDLHANKDADINPHYAPYARLTADATIARLKGDYAAAVILAKTGARMPDDFSVLGRGNYIRNAMLVMVSGHDQPALRGWLRELGWRAPPLGPQRTVLAMERQDWRDLLAQEKAMRQRIADTSGVARKNAIVNLGYAGPDIALAHAKLGDFAGAERLLALVPAYRDEGLRVHAQVAELQGQHARADWWFARAVAHAPSLPFANTLWGKALLARGQPDAAIEKFTAANRLGPKFADPLEGWGEALMARNQSHLALAKFAEANKYAPNWGRLHLKWGEALYYAGKRDDAKAQFARAAALDLTPSEKSELSKATHV